MFENWPIAIYKHKPFFAIILTSLLFVIYISVLVVKLSPKEKLNQQGRAQICEGDECVQPDVPTSCEVLQKLSQKLCRDKNKCFTLYRMTVGESGFDDLDLYCKPNQVCCRLDLRSSLDPSAQEIIITPVNFPVPTGMASCSDFDDNSENCWDYNTLWRRNVCWYENGKCIPVSNPPVGLPKPTWPPTCNYFHGNPSKCRELGCRYENEKCLGPVPTSSLKEPKRSDNFLK